MKKKAKAIEVLYYTADEAGELQMTKGSTKLEQRQPPRAKSRRPSNRRRKAS